MMIKNYLTLSHKAQIAGWLQSLVGEDKLQSRSELAVKASQLIGAPVTASNIEHIVKAFAITLGKAARPRKPNPVIEQLILGAQSTRVKIESLGRIQDEDREARRMAQDRTDERWTKTIRNVSDLKERVERLEACVERIGALLKQEGIHVAT
jgi:hypothetical protein